MRKANMFLLLIIFVSSNIITMNVLFSKLNEANKQKMREENTDMDTENEVTCSHEQCTCRRNMFGRMIILRAITISTPASVAVAGPTETSGRRMKYKKLPFNFTLYDAAAVRCAYVFCFSFSFTFYSK